MTDTKALRELLAKATPPKEWQDGGDGILFGHSADDSGVWHAGDSTLACALVNAAPALLDEVEALRMTRGGLDKWQGLISAYVGEAREAAFRAGAEAMREAAAGVADNESGNELNYQRGMDAEDMALTIADAIRALPLPEDK